MHFSKPVKLLEIQDYPLGGSKRGYCKFWIETNQKGSRILKQTFGKPKVSTYTEKAAIVTGEDGKTYFLMLNGTMIQILRTDFKLAFPAVFHNQPEFNKLKELIEKSD